MASIEDLPEDLWDEIGSSLTEHVREVSCCAMRPLNLSRCAEGHALHAVD